MYINQAALVSILASALALSACTITDTTSSTSGTLDAVTPDVTLNRFVDVRMASIRKEAAAGEGENLDALAELMGRDRNVFGPWMQAHYQTLFNDLESSQQLVARIERISPRS